jgi:hypothetical protein
MASEYTPSPVMTEHVVLNEDLLALVEVLAENAHEVWAQQRIVDGWTFGPERCDASRLHPCLVPYRELPETEKAYDRNVVLATIRTVVALGFTVQRNPPG